MTTRKGAWSSFSLCARLNPSNATFWSIHTFSDISMLHMLAIPGESNIAFAVHDDQATCAGGSGAKKGNCRGSGVASRLSMDHVVGGAFGDQEAHEVFAVACAGDGGVVIGIEATANEGRVTYTARILVSNASCGGSCGQVSFHIDRYRADGAMSF